MHHQSHCVHVSEGDGPGSGDALGVTPGRVAAADGEVPSDAEPEGLGVPLGPDSLRSGDEDVVEDGVEDGDDGTGFAGAGPPGPPLPLPASEVDTGRVDVTEAAPPL